jgi:membrane-bound lytic murein transglycosylase D
MGNAHPQAMVRLRTRSRGDWRLALFGAGCTVLGGACLLLAACSGNPSKPTAASAGPSRAPEIVAPPPAASPSQPQPEPAVLSTSPWARLRQRFSMAGCDFNPASSLWTRRFSRDAAGFSASLSQALPFLLVVLEQIEKRDMPGEFAFLPYIESNYTPIFSTGDRAAGIWQLMPDTAREAGLAITREYDGRLDIGASTTTALDLLERYQEELGDWRLADMAFNAGEYGMKDLIGDNTQARTAAEISHLHVPAHAHEHLAKLLAVSCIVSDPERFHVELPEAQADDELAAVDLPAPADFGLVAHLARIDYKMLRQLNPGYLRGHMPDAGPYRLLVPAAQRLALASALDQVPQSLWRDWHEIVLQRDESIDVLATAHGLDTGALAAANMIALDATLPAGTHLLLPGRAESGRAQLAIAKVERAVESSTTHVVRAGDTLWSIAQRASVRVDDLLHWNGLRGDPTLHLGLRLRLQPPDGGGSGATAAGAP